MSGLIARITSLDLILSLDSVITAEGMAARVAVMVIVDCSTFGFEANERPYGEFFAAATACMRQNRPRCGWPP
ncbi:MAG TPA: hypothetical protein VLS88_11035 [Polyangiales bacterium]|nr:hypothetical protein [Polyangiales bacterium]